MQSVFQTLFGHFFSFAPLVSLVGFVIVPVQHRLPFAASVDLAIRFFICAFLYVFIAWVMSKETVQGLLRNATENAWSVHNGTKNTTIDGNGSTLRGIEP